MSAETSTSVMLQALVDALVNPPSDVWGQRVSIEQFPETTKRPSVIINVVSQTRPSLTNAPDALNRVTVRCISEDIKLALDGQEEIERRLDDSGAQGRNTLKAFEGWGVSDCVSVGAVFFREHVPNGTGLYHAGHDYRIRMFRR